MVISVYVGGMYVDVENLAQTGSAFMAYMPLYIGEMWDVGDVGRTDRKWKVEQNPQLLMFSSVCM